MVKIAICGKMASGKTTMAEKFVNQYDNFDRYSLAEAVKRFARFVYDIPEGHKDRVAFQKIGDGARKELYENIWIDTVLNEVSHHEALAEGEGILKNFVIDDVRYANEVINLRKDGWITIKIHIDDELQIERLKERYPNDWEVHVGARHHASEAEVDDIPEDMFDVVVSASNNNEPFAQVEDYIFNVLVQ